MAFHEDEAVIDFGAHLHPIPVSLPEPLAEFEEILGPHYREPEAAADWFEAGGVDAAVLSQPFFMGHPDPEAVAEGNDILLEVLDGFDQFYALAAMPTPAGGDVCAEELERCLDNGYNGGVLETSSDGIELHHDGVDPIFDVADRRGAPIFVHPKIDNSLGGEVLNDDYRLNAIFGREVALAQSICKVIHTGVLDRYPDLNLVYHHTAGNIASMMGIINLQLDDGRWPQEHVKSFEEFKAQLEDRIYLDTAAYFGYHAPLRAALEEFPSSQILFGTDAPFHPRSPEEVADWRTTVEDLTAGPDTRKILGGNALDLLVNLD